MDRLYIFSYGLCYENDMGSFLLVVLSRIDIFASMHRLLYQQCTCLDGRRLLRYFEQCQRLVLALLFDSRPCIYLRAAEGLSDAKFPGVIYKVSVILIASIECKENNSNETGQSTSRAGSFRREL